ncbi:MAG: hypothetical protein JWO46_164 [Nocardioidaceae bacterium]|nr:hypothetical protein [Nocardioidaceae bacterium]
MRRYHRGIRLLVVLLAAVLVASVGSGVLQATAARVSVLSMKVDRPSISLQVGARAVFAVTVDPRVALSRPVSLTVTGAPKHSDVTIKSSPMTPGLPSVVSVQTSPSTRLGSYDITVTGESGAYHQSKTVRLQVLSSTGLRLVLSPPARSIVAGGTTTYDLTINRAANLRTNDGRVKEPVTLKVSWLPKGVKATVSPRKVVRGDTATITITTTGKTRPGTYRFVVEGRARGIYGWAYAYLTVRPQDNRTFTISGSADRLLAPGAPSGAMDLALTNPANAALKVTSLTVTVTGTNHAGCGPENYAVTAYGGPFPLAVPANSTRTLQQLGVPRAQWPQVAMLNLPVNQDACKGATVQLHLAGTGSDS